MGLLEELTERSPIRVLDRSIQGGLGTGNLGVVWGEAGLGKSAFLVALALDELMRDRRVVHVALDQPAERVRDYYDEIFRELVRSEGLARGTELWLEVERGLHVLAYPAREFGLDGLERKLRLLEEQTGLEPDLLVVDGYDWSAGDERTILGLKSLARGARCELWMSATARPGFWEVVPGAGPDPMARYRSLVDVLVRLQGDGGKIHVRILKDHDHTVPQPVPLDLDPTTLLLVRA